MKIRCDNSKNEKEKTNFFIFVTIVLNPMDKLKVTSNKIISIIAHDLKDPLSSISGISDILIKNWDDFSVEEKAEILHEIRDTSDSTLLLLSDLLDWSKKTAAISEPERSVFDASQQIAMVVEPLTPKLKRKNIVIENIVNQEIMVFGDANMFSSVIRNLLTNAVKSCHHGGTISITAEPTHDMIRFLIKDNGIGMTKAQVESLFPKDMKDNGKHNAPKGFGLLLCNDFARMNGGDIWAESEEGKGTQVSFTIPAPPKV